MRDLTLVVMAAGMGSRFGGLKQITPVDDAGNFLLDYSVFDARRAGFNKVVFVIKEENLTDFEQTVGHRLENQIEVCYAFQKVSDVPITMDTSKREKPWGTVQAILCAKDYIDGPFAVINADDFYGAYSFREAALFLGTCEDNYTYANISYPFGTTKSDYGAVKRGVLFVDQEEITSIVESSIDYKDGSYIASPLDGAVPFEITLNTPVSMNFFAFQKDVLEILEEYWQDFFNQDTEVLFTKEALLPECINAYLHKKRLRLINCPTKGKWMGMTYKRDLDEVKKEIKALQEKGEYKVNLWG